MKPNNKAYQAALAAYYSENKSDDVYEIMKDVVDAAYAAQFKCEDYVGLLRKARIKAAMLLMGEPIEFGSDSEIINNLSDALEAVLAERSEHWENKKRFAIAHAALRTKEISDELEALKTERDALLARLAPVEDEALVEIVADAISDGSKNIARAAIAAIRPHIEAVERERASKDYEALFQERVNQAASALAAAIRRGK